MLDIAFSPCPNDTFLFHAWLTGKVGKDLPVTAHLADIQQLNEWALKGRYPLMKVSFNCLGHLLDDYVLLPVGSALGFGCGPKLIAREGFSLSALTQKRVAIPGKETTANFLLDTLAPPPKEKQFCLYHEIVDRVVDGESDVGLIIHESRFTFQQKGLVEIADLGEMWEERYRMPIPLGGLVARRDLGEERLGRLTEILQESLKAAWEQSKAAEVYILEHSQDKAAEVVQRHIETYVTQDSLQISQEGVGAIDLLLKLGRDRGHFPETAGTGTAKDWLFEPKGATVCV